MHDDVVGREDLVDVIDRNGLGQIGRARGEEARGLVVDARFILTHGIFRRAVLHEVPVGHNAFGGVHLVVEISHDDDLGPVVDTPERLGDDFLEFRVVDEGLRFRLVDEQGDFAAGEAVVERRIDAADLVRGDIREDEFGGIQQGVHNHVITRDAARHER